MSITRSIPLNVKVEPQLRTDFKALCDLENVNIALAIQDYMKWSIDKGTVRINICSSAERADIFTNREIETLKDLTFNYNQLLKNFASLQKQVSQLEQIVLTRYKT